MFIVVHYRGILLQYGVLIQARHLLEEETKNNFLDYSWYNVFKNQTLEQAIE